MGEMDPNIWNLALKWNNYALTINLIFVVLLCSVFVLQMNLFKKSVSATQNGNCQKETILKFSVRYLVLAIIAFTSTNAINLTNIFRHKMGISISIIMIKNILMNIDSFVNMACLYLQCTFADQLYEKIASGCCCTWDNMYKQSDNKHIVKSTSDKSTDAITYDHDAPTRRPQLQLDITELEISQTVPRYIHDQQIGVISEQL